MASDLIIRGPEPSFTIPDTSLAQFLYPIFRSHAQDNVIQIDSETGEVLTAGGFLLASLKLSVGLQQHGLTQGQTVAFVSNNRTHLFTAAMGVIWSGAAVAPVDPSLKTFEMKHMFSLLQPSFVFCERPVLATVQDTLNSLDNKATIIVFDPLEDDVKKNGILWVDDLLVDVDVDVENYVPLPVESPASQVVLISPSSGSTGLPKGVGLTHRNLLFQLLVMTKDNTQKDDPFQGKMYLQVSHFFWISGTLALLLSSATGMARVFVRNFTVENILHAIHQYKPHVSIIAPSVLSDLLNHPAREQYNVTSLELIMTGGSAVAADVRSRLQREWSPEINCYQMYGMTECGVVTKNTAENDFRSCGALAVGCQVKVVDVNTGETLGQEQVGEFYIKTPGVMKGYFNNEDYTRQILGTDGWLHSGDLGYYKQDGTFYIVDRLKEMVKVRNQQVSPAEIECLLMLVPGVLEVGVAGVPHPEDMYHLVALVVKEENADVTEESIMAVVKDNMSEYKELKGGVYFVESLPRTPTGKIRRLQLKDLAKTLYDQRKSQ